MLVTDRVYTAVDGQSVFDIAIQEYGHLDGVVWLCLDNDIHTFPEEFEGSSSANQKGKTFNLRNDYVNKKNVDSLRPYNPIISKK